MDLDGISSILLQTLMALLVIEEQVSSTRAIYLHMLQLPKNQIDLKYVHDHPHVPREQGWAGSTRVVSHCHFQQQVDSCAEVFPVPSPTSANALDIPCRKNCGVSSNNVYSPCSSGEYISPESSHLLGSITGIQQLTVVTQKYNLQTSRLLAVHTTDNSMRHGAVAELSIKTNVVCGN